MKYLFVSDEPDGFVGTLYEIKGTARKKVRKINVESLKSVEVRVAIVCQKVAEGGNLDEWLGHTWSFGKSEFFSVLKTNPEWEAWFSEAQGIRNKMVVEETFDKLKKADLTSDKAESFAKILKTIQDSIKKNEEDGGIKTIINAYVYQPKAVKERRWSLKE